MISGQEISSFQKNVGMLGVTVLITIVIAGPLICSIIGMSAVLGIVHAGFHTTAASQLALESEFKV